MATANMQKIGKFGCGLRYASRHSHHNTSHPSCKWSNNCMLWHTVSVYVLQHL